METLKKREILQDLLTEYEHSGWYVIEPNKLNPANCIVFNPKEKKMGEVFIPDDWLDDPRRRNKIAESLALTIHHCNYDLPQAYLSSSRLSRP